MKSLTEVIIQTMNESRGSMMEVIPKKPSKFIKALISSGISKDIINQWMEDHNITDQILDDIYTKARRRGGLQRMPFVVNYQGRRGFCVRRWVPREFKGHNWYKKDRGVFKGVHDTSFNDNLSKRTNRAEKGLVQENYDIYDLIVFCERIYEYFGEKYDVEKGVISELFSGDPGMMRFYDLYASGALNPIINRAGDRTKGVIREALSQDEKNLIKKYNKVVKSTGKRKTARNSDGKILTNKGEIPEIDSNSITASGKIIADITISKTETYISCKLLRAQFSGISVLNFCKALTNFVAGHVTDADKTYLDNFLKNFDIDPQVLIDAYKNNNFKSEIDLRPGKEPYKSRKLGDLFQILIGGNYWYLNEEKCEYIPGEYAGFTFTVDKATIRSGDGKTIHIEGTIGSDIHCKFSLRTDGSHKYPHRLFPVIDSANFEKYIKKLPGHKN